MSDEVAAFDRVYAVNGKSRVEDMSERPDNPQIFARDFSEGASTIMLTITMITRIIVNDTMVTSVAIIHYYFY